MNLHNRRVFILHAAIGGTTAMLAGHAGANERLKESDPQAIALGYREDTKTVDRAKYPKHNAEQKCVNCMIWKGKGAEGGTCHLFGRKLLSGDGWCSQYERKA